MSAKFTPLAALLSVCLLGAKCGDKGTPNVGSGSSDPAATPASQTQVDACSLLTPAEVEAVTKAKVTATKPETYGANTTCNFEAANQLLPVVSLVLAGGMPDVKSSAEMAQWRSKQGTSFGDIKIIIEPVEGLGVPAIKNEVEGAGLVTVEVAAKGKLLDVTTGSLEMSKALAPKAIARLQ
jgi:hypothetical protein